MASKMISFWTLIVIFSFSAFVFTDGQLIDATPFIKNVGKRMVSIIEEKEITGNGLPMKDFEIQINETLYNVNAFGTIRFNSGFVSKINESEIDSKTIVERLHNSGDTSLEGKFIFRGVQVVYDVAYNLVGYVARGSFLIFFPELNFELEVKKSAETKEITAAVPFLTAGSQNNFIIKVYENNAYSQILAREMKRSFTFREPLMESIEEWHPIMQAALNASVTAFPFPEICYYCP